MRLTEHFTVHEFTRSARHPELMAVNLAASGPYLHNMLRVCAELEKLREHIARPVYITSGFRCPELNAAVGGSPHSAHTRGLAADFVVKDFQDPDGLMLIYKWCADNFADGGQIIFEHPDGRKPWIHFGLSTNPAGFILPLEKLLFIGGKYSRYER